VTDLGGERLEGLPRAGCLRQVIYAHGDGVVVFVALRRVAQRQCAARTLLGARDAREHRLSPSLGSRDEEGAGDAGLYTERGTRGCSCTIKKKRARPVFKISTDLSEIRWNWPDLIFENLSISAEFG
jgi:hypothetical protein